MSLSRMQRCVVLAALALWPVSESAIASAAPGATAETSWFRVKNVRQGSVLWIRAGPARTYKKIGFLRHNARHVRSFGCRRFGTSMWCQIRHRGIKGWVFKKYLSVDVRFRA